MQRKAKKPEKPSNTTNSFVFKSLFNEIYPSSNPPMFIYRNLNDKSGKFLKLRCPKYIQNLEIKTYWKLTSKLAKVKKIHFLNLKEERVRQSRFVKHLMQHRKSIGNFKNENNIIKPKIYSYFPGIKQITLSIGDLHLWSVYKKIFKFQTIILDSNGSHFYNRDLTLDKKVSLEERMRKLLCRIIRKSIGYGFLKKIAVFSIKATQGFLSGLFLQLASYPHLF